MRPTASRLKALMLLALFPLIPACHKEGGKTLNKSVVKVFTHRQNADFYEPWKTSSQDRQQGCGCILPEGRILTTAHLINKAIFIEVQKFGETKRYAAKAEKVGFDTDLALLTVEDKDFSKGVVPVEFGELPSPGDKLTVQGGDHLSVKEDTVSGLDMVWSTEGDHAVPAILTNSAIDGALNGCPVFKDGKFVGIPFDAGGKPEKAGALLPVNFIQRFFKAVQDGRAYEGLPDLGVYTQNLVSPSLRSYYKVPSDKTGVVVTRVLYGGAAEGFLKEGDVLTSLDGHPLDNEGDVSLGKEERIDEEYLIDLRLIGEKASFDVLRDGKALKVEVPLKPFPYLIPWREDTRHPSYFVFGGFIFVPLTKFYFLTGRPEGFKPRMQDLYGHGVPSQGSKQVVMVSHVLPHEMNRGYNKFSNLIVEKVNGRPISDMRDLIAAFDHPLGKYHVMEFDEHTWFGSTIVLDAARARQATQEILRTFKIPSDRSQDLK